MPFTCQLKTCALFALVLIPFLTAGTSEHGRRAPQGHHPWSYLGEKHGVKIYEKEVPGQDVPVFRAEGVVNAPFWKVVRVLRNANGHSEWVPNCRVSKVLAQDGFRHLKIYQRFKTPWPVWDRDVVLDVRGRQNGKAKEAIVQIRALHAKHPAPPKRVVRIEHLRSTYRISSAGPNHTRIAYDVDMHLGGSLPDWLIRMVVRKMPVQTFDGLREHLRHSKEPNTEPSFS